MRSENFNLLPRDLALVRNLTLKEENYSIAVVMVGGIPLTSKVFMPKYLFIEEKGKVVEYINSTGQLAYPVIPKKKAEPLPELTKKVKAELQKRLIEQKEPDPYYARFEEKVVREVVTEFFVEQKKNRE